MGASLVTLAEYKAYANIKSETQDAAINSIIPKVSQLVKTICRRSFIDYVSADKVEVFSSGILHLSEYPVISVTKVEQSDDRGVTYYDLTSGEHYILDQELDAIIPYYSDFFPRKPNGYRVTYRAGFTTLPEDLKLAVFDLISYYLKNDSAVHSNKSPGTNSVQIEYISTTNLPANIKRVLDQYMAHYL